MVNRNTYFTQLVSLSIGILLLLSILSPIGGALSEEGFTESSEELRELSIEDEDEWYIGPGETEYLNGTEKGEFAMDSHITIDGGRLEINNATLTLLIDGFHPWEITVENGGELELWNSAIRTQPPDDLLRPFLKTEITATDDSTLHLQHGSSFRFPGWVRLENSKLLMEDSSFEALENVPTFDYTWGYGDRITGERDNENCPMLIATDDSEVLMMDSEINDYYTNTALSRMDWYASDTSPEDNTGENLESMRERDGRTYSVAGNETMHIDEWSLDDNSMDFPAANYPYLNPIDRITALYLEVNYNTDDNFTEAELEYKHPDWDDWKTAETLDEDAEDIEKSIWNIDLDQFDRDESEDRFIYDLEMRFTNPLDEEIEDASVNFDRIRLVSAYENDIRIEDSEMTVINSYIDIDFRASDVDPRATSQPTTGPENYLEDSNPQHRVIRVYDSDFKAYGLEVTGEAIPDGDPAVVEGGDSTSEIYRWAHVEAVDETQKSIDGAEIVVDFDLTQEHQEAIDYRNRNYPGEYDDGVYVTGNQGISTLILRSDELSHPDRWPNGRFHGRYSLDGSYTDDEGDLHTTSKDIGLSSFPNLTAEANNPQYALEFDMTVPLPDLNVGTGDLTIDNSSDPGDIVVDEEVEIGLAVSNDGERIAEDISVEFYLDDSSIADGEIDEIEAGGQEELQTSWTPEGEDLGARTLSAVVDPHNEIEERVIDNREVSIDIDIVERPNLSTEEIVIVGDFYEDERIKQGESVEVSAEVTNIGGAEVEDVTVEIGVIDGEEIGISTVDLSAGEYITTPSSTWDVPDEPDEYTLYAEIDPEGQIEESDDTNNRLVRNVEVVSEAEITIDTLELDFVDAEEDERVWVGDTVEIEAMIENEGGWRSEEIEISFYVDHDEDTEEFIGATDIEEGLEYGASQTVTAEWEAAIHEDFDESSQERDITGIVTEGDEERSLTSDPFTVEEVMALEITHWSEAFDVTEGESVSVTATIENVGDVYAQEFTLSLYLDNTMIVEENYSDLAVGEAVQFEYDWEAERSEERDQEDRIFRLEITETEPELSRDPETREIPVLVRSLPDLEFIESNWIREGEEIGPQDVLELEEKDDLIFNGTVENKGGTDIEEASAQFIFPDGERKNISIDVMAGESAYVDVEWTVEGSGMQDIMVQLLGAEHEDATVHQEFIQEIDVEALEISLSGLNYPEESDPGEEYSFSGALSRDSDGKNLADVTIRVIIEDEDGEEITSSSATTDEDGEFILPLRVPDDGGDYTLVFEPQTAMTQREEISITVGEEETAFPLWLVVLIVAAAAGGGGSLIAYLKFFGPEELVECGNCGASISADSSTCPKCGVEFDMNTVKCSECGEWIPATSDDCPECGAEFIKTGEEVEDYAERMRNQYEKFVLKQKQEVEDRLGRDLSKQEFLRWWKQQPSFVTFDEWLERKEKQRKKGGQECPKCGTLNSVDDGVCQKCGTSLIEVEIMKEKGSRRREEEEEEEESTESSSSLPMDSDSEEESLMDEEDTSEDERRSVKKTSKKRVKKKVIEDSDEE